MAVVTIGNYYAEWQPSGNMENAGRGRIILRSATRLSDLYFLNGLSAAAFRNLLHMLQTEKPVYWDNDRFVLRTAHPQSHDAEPVGDQEAHA